MMVDYPSSDSHDSIAGELEAHLRERLQSSLELLGGFGTLSALPDSSATVPDNPLKSVIHNKGGVPIAVLFCSRAVAPDYVAQEHNKASRIRNHLGDRLGHIIRKPLLEGYLQGRSYAVMPWRQPLSNSRWIRGLQKAAVGATVLTWLREACAATLASPETQDIEPQFVIPLGHISKHPHLSIEIRQQARSARERLLSGEWLPKHVLDHNDFWMGNVLLDLPWSRIPRVSRRFVLIDWRGANIRGYGFVDLLRMARSIGLSRSVLAREFARLRRVLDCSPGDAEAQVLAGLGHRGMDLEYFPAHRYVRSVERCWGMLSALREG